MAVRAFFGRPAIRPRSLDWDLYRAQPAGRQKINAVQYDHLYNAGVLDGNQVTGTESSREPNIIVFHGGVNFRF